jgi:hypothetical protein
MIRMLIIVGSVLLVSSAAADAQPRELKGSQGRAVFVIDANRQEWQGRLLKVSAEALEVESDAGIRTFRLAEIRRVDADGDATTDGFLKGAAIGAGFGLLALANMPSGWVILSNALTFGLIGLAVDAGCTSRHPVYHGPAVPHLDTPTTRSPAASVQVSMKVRW